MSSGVPVPQAHTVSEEKVDDKKENIDTNGNIQNAKNRGKGQNNYFKGSRRPRVTDEERRTAWEIEQAKKPILEKGVKGRVKWYSVRYHYGFIARDDGEGNDVFVHQTAIAKSKIIKYYLRTLGDGEEVVFDIVEGKQGPEAANVTGPNGSEVRGSRFHNFQFYNFRRRMAYRRERLIYQENEKHRRDEQNRKSNETQENGNADIKKPNAGRRRRIRNFRARRPPIIVQKCNGDGDHGEGEDGGGDSKKESNNSDVNNGVHTEGRGDVHQSARKHDTKDASQYGMDAAEKEIKNAANTAMENQ
uniref:CSP domain-containing protein n=1 Tax=Elaeophora elaphi TaxID=1147741 RepID=A0A158Q8Y0_9BILA